MNKENASVILGFLKQILNLRNLAKSSCNKYVFQLRKNIKPFTIWDHGLIIIFSVVTSWQLGKKENNKSIVSHFLCIH